MDIATQQARAQTFHALHLERDPLILFNAWDVASAKAIAKSSPALATSSAAVAASLGFADGEAVPFDLVLGLISRTAAAVKVPVSIDLEAGYGSTPEAVAKSVRRVLEAGAVGINLEDGLADGQRRLADAERQADKIRAAREAAQSFGVSLFINARTDPFLLKFGSPGECLKEALRRAALYADAGASGIFVPGLTDLGLIAQMVGASPLALNVMVMDTAVEVSELARARVRRISMGPWPMMAAMRAVAETASLVISSKRFGGFLLPAS